MAASKSSRSKHDACHGPSVGIDLEDVKDIGAERIMSLVAAQGSDTTKDEVPAADRDGVWRHARDPDLGECRDFGDHGIAALSASLADHPPTIVGRNIGGEDLGHRVPVAGRKARLQPLVSLACRVFQSALLRMQLF